MKSALFAFVGFVAVSVLAGCEATPAARAPVAWDGEPLAPQGETTLTAATLPPISPRTQIARWEDIEPAPGAIAQTWGSEAPAPELPASPY